MMRFNKLSFKGSSPLNEDALVADSLRNVYGVIDGATSLTPYTSADGATGGYLASRLVASTIERLLNQGKVIPLPDMLLEANRILREEMLHAGIDVNQKEQLWSAGAVVIRILTDGIEYAQTGTLSDGTTKDVTNQAEWTSSSYKIADVEKGLVTIVDSGKATITAKYSGKTITIPVDVNQLKYFATDEVQLEIKKGTTKTVIATATYLDGTDEDVSIPALWASSNILIASVRDGKIKANGVGKATITVTYAGKSTKVVVTVTK